MCPDDLPSALPERGPRAALPSIAIVGATGAVGVELCACLEQRGFPLASLRLLGSPRSAGREVAFAGRTLRVGVLDERSFEDVDPALFSAGASVSRQYAALAVEAGAMVVDNSSAFRMNPDVPLVVPEINAADIVRHHGIIANPNCVAIIAVVALWPLQQAHAIRRVQACTYQAASGAGAAAMQELLASTSAYLAGETYAPRVMKHPYAFNLFSHDAAMNPETGYNGEEEKVMAETRKIMGLPELRVGVTCVRVPVLRAHAIALTVEFEERVSPEKVRGVLAAAPGLRVVDDRSANHFPMPNEATGQGDVLVGRIRTDVSDPSSRSISLFVAGDQLLKGAALNAVQIAERLYSC